MQLGVCIVHGERPVDEAFAAARALGFGYCQLVSWDRRRWTAEEAARIREACARHDMHITAFWCGWGGPACWDFYDGQETLGLVPETYRYARMQDLMDGADFAASLGVAEVVTHMGFLPENPHDPRYAGVVAAIRTVARHLLDHRQTLLFETGQETPVTLRRAIEDVGTGNLGVNLDPANLVMYGKANPVDALDVIGPFVRGVHAKDGKYPENGRELGPEVPIGSGKVDFPRLIRRLRECGFDGCITIEREISGEQQERDIRQAKAYLQTLLSPDSPL